MTPRRRTNEEILNGGVLSCTIPEAQQVLGVGRKAVLDLCEAGTLHSFPVGRSKRVGVASLKKVAGAQAT